ncbi:S8 family serine peptidase [Actinoplanes sp. NBRC 101535]|uniref:S8 family serine peptidase n=1 Tax=Actinoplanes sp. NBRC 101535 TaxID=3032196 RepID=UPI002556DF9C|nr:S8 family serine peptidase [Actinoplanes sp. NBRC 101535]
MRTTTRAVLAVMLGAAVSAGLGAPAAAANQYYYTVTASHGGAPENLWEIAARFLGDAGRAGEILDLNAGRPQPDGGTLSDASRLTEGWRLVLPFDAVGTELQYGPLPAVRAAAPACDHDDSTADGAWGQEMLAPQRVWATADGTGVDVAVVGSGVDGTAAALAGRVTPGADLAAGTGRGDTTCAGTGTALAGIVAGDDGAGGEQFGLAPKARIVPVRIGSGTPSTTLAASAITVAAGTGAQVILVADGVDATGPEVRAAIREAITRDVVVVLPATAGAEPTEGLLRTTAVDETRRPAADPSGGGEPGGGQAGGPVDVPAVGVDVSGPGVAVTSIGGTGSGPGRAAAFVAGAAALLRSAHPALPAVEVTRQLRATATDGLIDPVAAINTPLPEGVGANADPVATESALNITGRVLLRAGAILGALTLMALLLQSPARRLRTVLARRRDHRQALAARAQVSADIDDPFWDAPADHPNSDATQQLVIPPR